MRKVFIFDFDGTFYSGEHKFDNVKDDIEKNRRIFLPNLTDEEYELICNEYPRWNSACTGNDIVRCILRLAKKYPTFPILISDFYNWQNDFIYNVIIDYNQVINPEFIKNLCDNYSVYVVSNSSLKHIEYYMNKINVNPAWFKKVIGNEFKKEDPSKGHYYKEIMESEATGSHNFYVFGDSVDSDLTPALHLGMNAFYVDNAANIPNLVNTVIENEI